MVERKYELVMDYMMHLPEITLYRIKALKSFGDVEVGDLGGYIEPEDNLSHYGDCWVHNYAWVYGKARVYGDARVFGNTRIYGKAQVYGNAKVYDKAQVFGNAKVYGNAIMKGYSIAYDKVSNSN